MKKHFITSFNIYFLGAFDPLEEIADLCSKYNLWMHVDAAWGNKIKNKKK